MVAGQRLREARKKANLTQEELANIIGVKAAEVSQYESNKRTPRWPTFNKLLDALHITADEVLGRDVTVHDGEDYAVFIHSDDCAKDCDYQKCCASDMHDFLVRCFFPEKTLPEIL